MKRGSGIAACEDAFERLIAGEPVVAAHVGIDDSKITAGVVSVEAGFDRGYLKKGRVSHRPLIARIEARREEHAQSEDSLRNRLRRADAKAQVSRSEVTDIQRVLDKVLIQNLVLVERIKELEDELKQYQPKHFEGH
ncbi:hypothetical protein [Halomonas citrativorans]|uniref:hypothetical protein n=1 Tax=Halomonas citrativorans TaxID=2742612 RepID=UPI000B35D035|nr:hypothetical protein [Halomonas citrativorans]